MTWCHNGVCFDFARTRTRKEGKKRNYPVMVAATRSIKKVVQGDPRITRFKRQLQPVKSIFECLLNGWQHCQLLLSIFFVAINVITLMKQIFSHRHTWWHPLCVSQVNVWRFANENGKISIWIKTNMAGGAFSRVESTTNQTVRQLWKLPQLHTFLA